MNKNLFESHMKRFGDTQQSLASAMGISLSRLNAKINEREGAEFTQTEIEFIAKRYSMSGRELVAVFFDPKVS